MVKKVALLEKLSRKGMHVSVPILDKQEWYKLVKSDPAIPKSFQQLRLLSRSIFGRKQRPKVR
jgi:hypothetical protein